MAPRSLLLRYRRIAVWAVLTAGLSLAVLTWRFTARQEEARIRTGFYSRAQTQITVASQNLRRYEEMVYSLRDAFLASEDITREEFSALSRSIRARHSSVQALEWVAFVPHAERADFERRTSAELGRPFSIMQRQPDGSRTVAGEATDYAVVQFVEPFAGNEQALGYDLHTAPSHPQIVAARQDRRFKVSPAFRLIQSADPHEQGVTLILPFFRGSGPVTGLIQGVFQLNQMLAESHQLGTTEALDTFYFDLPADGSAPKLLYANFGGATQWVAPEAQIAPPNLDDPSYVQRTLRLGDRQWRVAVRMNERWAQAVTSRQPLVILAAGSIIALLFAYSLHTLLERNSLIAAEVAERTAELAESQRRLSALLSDMPGAAYRCGVQPPHPTFFVSDGILALCGYPAAEFLAGRLSWQSLMREEDIPAVRRQIEEATAKRSHFEIEYSVRHADGTDRHVWERGRAVYSPEGYATSLEGLMVDVTARKEAEARTREFDRQIIETQKLESLGVLAGGIAHDFNNLLTAILGHASLARYELPSDHLAAGQLRQIENASRRAADLCTQMLAYAGKGNLSTGHIDLSDLVRDTTQLLEVTLRKSTQLQLELAPSLPLVQADASKLRQIVMNLVINAAEAIGDAAGTVALRTFAREVDAAEFSTAVQKPALPTGLYVGLEVQDSGSGMAPEVLARIFEPFFTTKFSGRGLGLSAVLGIVRSHQGALYVESNPGAGSTFRLLLPAATDAFATPQPRTVSNPASDGRAPLPELHGTVLVVDDEAHVREMTALALQMVGLDTLAAQDGEEALHLCQKHGELIDLIILDLTMPGLSGEETLRRLRTQGATQKVILYSGYSAAQTAKFSAQLGAAAFLPKPFEISALLDEVRRHLPERK